MTEHSFIGERVPRVDALEKVTGEADYCADLKIPGMLFGKIKRSPYPFARILSIDTSSAQKLPGVRAVITAQDVTQFAYGLVLLDELPLASDYVRYIGDEVAAVAAVDEDTAEEALDLIRVEYEELTPVFDPEKAVEPGAPAIHPELEGVKHNVAHHINFVRGDGDSAFKRADFVIGDRFSTQGVHQAYLETQGCIAQWDVSGKLTMWGSTQSPFYHRTLIAKALGIPEHQVRMIHPCVGGGFGSKAHMLLPLYPISAFLSKKTGKPVQIIFSRTEDFIAGRPRSSEKIDLRLGFKKDGTIVAKDAVLTLDTGAYSGITPIVLQQSANRPGSLYRIPNIKVVANVVYTNKIPRGAMRGFGNPEMDFACESLMDMAAEELGIDPMEIRLKNATQKGDITAHGWIINSCGLTDSIKIATRKSDWQRKRKNKDKYHGIGMACMVHLSSHIHPPYDGSAAFVHIDQLGKVSIVSGEAEIGQGATTVFTQIVAEELGVPLEDIRVLPLDTDVSPYSLGTYACRVTVIGGNAVRMAAIDAREQLLGYAADKLKAGVEDIVIQNRKVYPKGCPEQGTPLVDLARDAVLVKRGGLPIIGNGKYVVPDWVVPEDRVAHYGNSSLAYPFCTQVAEVSIDPDTGKVEVLNVWYAYDIGKVINLISAEGQVEGGVVQGIGYALSEEYVWENGKVLNPSFTDYKVPSWFDIPNINTSFIETNNPGTPYGAKGLGECSLVPTAPAIANAIYNAVGLRIKELPITPEKLIRALKKEKSEP